MTIAQESLIMQIAKKKLLTKRDKLRQFPKVRTAIRAGAVNFGAPNGGEEEIYWDYWVDPNTN